jgi:hypothetical protein
MGNGADIHGRPQSAGLQWDRLAGRRPQQSRTSEQTRAAQTLASIDPGPDGISTDRLVEVGGYVAVRTRYVGAWSNGFEVAAHVDRGCLIRRLSDGSVLPDVFYWTEIRPASRARDVA